MPTPRQSEHFTSASNTPAPPARTRASHVLIALFLAFQVVVPLSYYWGARGYDERFSWRMFSTLRLRDCKVQVTEYVGQNARSVNVERDVHLAWLRLLERMRGAVIDAYLQRRCAVTDAERVLFDGTCRDTDGHALAPTRRTLDCSNGRLESAGTP
jgi:hypothetical protein